MRATTLELARARIDLQPEAVVSDYRLAFRSRTASETGRTEVLRGRATFGIFGDGKEVVQVAMARAFRPGDWRAGYYRDQTLAWALGLSDVSEFFAHLYADAEREPSGARQMINHFSSPLVTAGGDDVRAVDVVNCAADLSPVAAHMPKLLGLAYASRLYRESARLREVAERFSRGGDEVVFGTIGEASTSEGVFFETVNAAVVLQVPLLLTVYDDGYGISVPVALQTAKASISRALSGLADGDGPGLDIRVVRGWDYPSLCDAYADGAERVRRDHRPALFHVTELTQPLGHSTSGSHERYKPAERLAWEAEHDCLRAMRDWMVESGIAGDRALRDLEEEERAVVVAARDAAWGAVEAAARRNRAALVERLDTVAASAGVDLGGIVSALNETPAPAKGLVLAAGFRALAAMQGVEAPGKAELAAWLEALQAENERRYRSHLYSESERSPLRLAPVPAAYADDAPLRDGRQVLLGCFDANLARDPRIFVIGEDVGRLGDVNLVFEGLADRHGSLRVTDTGIREATILGQAIGAAMRGLRPIADIQYLDYVLYAFETVADDLATLHWRTRGRQRAPVVIRTKGHRLVGIWHAGSPMSLLLNGWRGIYVCVPRNMTQAAGFYNTLLRGDAPAIVVEVLNGYRLKERMPSNPGELRVPLGVPEILRAGADVTVVTYGACCRIALDAAETLARLGADCEVIDVQTLSPFDTGGVIARSVAKTHAVAFLDEDVPGATSAFMMQRVLEEQDAWWHLDAAPRTITASECRPAYGPDGDYFTKPSRESVVRAIYALLRERRPSKYPHLDGA